MNDSPLLKISDLTIGLPGESGFRSVLRGFDLTLGRGETFGIVGESGSGKSIAALAIMGLLPDGARTSGSIVFDGVDLLALTDRQMGDVRGRRIGMVFQEPMTALNPSQRIGRQIAETIRLHERATGRAARERAIELLDLVKIDRPRERIDLYPHQLSGGQRQRVVIAIALACNPELLLADEPTTALDVTVQAATLDLLNELTDRLDMAMLLISHDLGVISQMCARTAVLYAGRLLEEGPTEVLTSGLAHPYTAGLRRARPHLDALPGERLNVLPGTLPDPDALPEGCVFGPRCAHAIAQCRATEPDVHMLAGERHWARCIRMDTFR